MFSWNSCEQWGKKTNKGDEKMKEKEKGRQERREGRKKDDIYPPVAGNSPFQLYSCENVNPNSKLQDSPWKNQ